MPQNLIIQFTAKMMKPKGDDENIELVNSIKQKSKAKTIFQLKTHLGISDENQCLEELDLQRAIHPA